MLTPIGVHEMESASAPYLRSMPCVICQSLILKTRLASCSSERDGGYMCEMLFTFWISDEIDEAFIVL